MFYRFTHAQAYRKLVNPSGKWRTHHIYDTPIEGNRESPKFPYTKGPAPNSSDKGRSPRADVGKITAGTFPMPSTASIPHSVESQLHCVDCGKKARCLRRRSSFRSSFVNPLSSSPAPFLGVRSFVPTLSFAVSLSFEARVELLERPQGVTSRRQGRWRPKVEWFTNSIDLVLPLETSCFNYPRRKLHDE